MFEKKQNDKRQHGPEGPPPESGMGGASGSGAHGPHPASAPAMRREHRSPGPGAVPGDAAIERRRRRDPSYSGEERRAGMR
jgi:hypothetical protein